MDVEYLRGIEEVQTREVVQLKREYVAVLGKLIVARAELEHTQSLIELENGSSV